MKKLVIYIALFLTGCSLLQAQSSTRNRMNKGPRGTFVFDDQLKEIFPYAEVKQVPTTIHNTLKTGSHINNVLLVTVSEFMPTLSDLQSIKSFARDGNNVLIFCQYLNTDAREFFGITDTIEGTGLPDSLRLLKDGQWALGSFSSRMFDGLETYFDSIPPSGTLDGKNITPLGINARGNTNFIRIKYGSGAVFIHLVPTVVTNYFLLEKQNHRYTQAVLSYLPRSVDKIFWKLPRFRRNMSNQSYDGNERSEFSFMSVIWGNAGLRWAFLLGLLVLLLLLLFGSKRRQRMIPVTQPVQNTTFEFAQTMGDLYFNQHNNAGMAAKKIKYWQEYVRNTYGLSTREMNAEFWDHLAKKSGQPADVLKNIEVSIVRSRNKNNLSDRDLVNLSNAIDQFYKA